jgi:hypothetical protein
MYKRGYNSILNTKIISTIFFDLLKGAHNNPISHLSGNVGRLPKKIDNAPFLIGYLAGTRSSGFFRLTSLACSA